MFYTHCNLALFHFGTLLLFYRFQIENSTVMPHLGRNAAPLHKRRFVISRTPSLFDQ